jgi:tRNA-intron endonuclease
MTIMVLFDEKEKTFVATDQSTMDVLRNGHIGHREGQRTSLCTEEGLYLIDARKAKCTSLQTGKEMKFNEIAMLFSQKEKFIARYFTYRDWRDRGLMISLPGMISGSGKAPVKKYPASRTSQDPDAATGVFFPEDLITIIDDEKSGRSLYDKFWFGQYGTYKLGSHGNLNKLDVYETLFLIDNKRLSLQNAARASVASAASERIKDFQKTYEIYKDWRSKGYVVKTGFKFGMHFRLYLPEAQPTAKGVKWAHSKHVINVFPREAKLIASEWARAIRVAHSVKKTFILAVPGKSKKKSSGIDFVLYYRKGGSAEAIENDPPSYAMLSFGEDEYIGGAELSAAIDSADKMKLAPVVAVADRETAVTYYKVNRVELSGSSCEYYEIDWMQP